VISIELSNAQLEPLLGDRPMPRLWEFDFIEPFALGLVGRALGRRAFF
jgi:hypothetical protein